jgi:hypothetical protein
MYKFIAKLLQRSGLSSEKASDIRGSLIHCVIHKPIEILLHTSFVHLTENKVQKKSVAAVL